MAREYYSLGSKEEDKRFNKQIIQLLKIRMAAEGWRNNSPELLTYLKSKYGLKLSTPKINKLLKGKSDDFNVFQKKYQIGFNDLVKYEPVQIKNDILKQADFLDYYEIDKVSTLQMMQEMIKGEYCFFFNTYLDLEDWHSPLIHLHQAIQKTTEYYINSRDESKKSRHFRIMFLYRTQEELAQELYPLESEKDEENDVDGQKNFFLQNFELSIHVHKALGINLGVVCLDQLARIIVSNLDFFNNIIVLSALGLNNIYEALNYPLKDMERKVTEQLKLELQALSKVPSNENNNPTAYFLGLDFLDIKKEIDDKKSIWVAYKDNNQGLSFSSMNSELAEDFYKYKRRFSDLILKEITTEVKNNPIEWDIPEEGTILTEDERNSLEIKFYKLLDSISNTNSRDSKHLAFKDDYMASLKLKNFMR